jgi:hypothetical protein
MKQPNAITFWVSRLYVLAQTSQSENSEQPGERLLLLTQRYAWPKHLIFRMLLEVIHSYKCYINTGSFLKGYRLIITWTLKKKVRLSKYIYIYIHKNKASINEFPIHGYQDHSHAQNTSCHVWKCTLIITLIVHWSVFIGLKNGHQIFTSQHPILSVAAHRGFGIMAQSTSCTCSADTKRAKWPRCQGMY